MNKVNIEDRMALSIVIVSYNTSRLLADCLKSLIPATKSLSFEVYVVDNNSQDNTCQMIKKEFPWVKLIESGENLGYSKANNLALKKAKGKYILILNPDTKVQANSITKAVSFLESHQGAGIVTCRVELPNGNLDPDCRRSFPTPWRSFCHFSRLSKLFPKTKLFDSYYMAHLSDKVDHEVDSCMGAFMLTKSEALKKIGLFDEEFFFYGEDLDLCWRAKEQGYKIYYTPKAKIIHYKGVASGMKSVSKHLTTATKESKKRAVAESTRAMRLFYKKHYQNKYPFLITWCMYLGIFIIEKYRLSKV